MSSADIVKLRKQVRTKEVVTIRLEDYQVSMFLGLHEFEKTKAQNVLISVRIELDDPELFWDYDKLVAFLETEIAGSQIGTQEELGSRLIEFIEKGPPVRSIFVETKKPDIFEQAGFVGLTRYVEYR